VDSGYTIIGYKVDIMFGCCDSKCYQLTKRGVSVTFCYDFLSISKYNRLYKFIKSQSLFTDLLTFRQPLLPSSELFLFAARRRHGEQFVIDMRKLVTRSSHYYSIRFRLRDFYDVTRGLINDQRRRLFTIQYNILLLQSQTDRCEGHHHHDAKTAEVRCDDSP